MEQKELSRIFVLEIWKGDFKETSMYSTLDAAKESYQKITDKAKQEGEYISDATLCEYVLEGFKFIQKGYSII